MALIICQLLICISFVFPSLVLASPYSSQQLMPVMLNKYTEQEYSNGNNYNTYSGVRIRGPKRKAYPVLDQFESKLYPRQDFRKENPGKRLDRLEIAVFGNKQKGSIKNRVGKLRAELEAWQIANEQVSTIIDGSKSRNLKKQLPQPPKKMMVQNYSHYPPPIYQTKVEARKKPVDYNYMNYRAGSSLVNSALRQSLNMMFRR